MEQQKETGDVKRLYRSKVDRIIAGVCGGFAEYFNIDPTIVRVLWLVVLFLSGFGLGLVIYLVCLIVMKDNPEQSFEDKKTQSTALYWGVGFVLFGLLLLSNRWDWNWYYFRPFHFNFLRPWFFHWDKFWPIVIILFGIFYLIYVLRKNKDPETEQEKTEETTATNKLFRSRDEKIVGGVCGGIAKHLDIDPVIVRIAWVVLSFATAVFFGIVVYIIWMIIVPEQPPQPAKKSATIETEQKPVKKTPKRVKKVPDKKDEKRE
jgi:phage shock protein PspC (stress-responsive transcriptional regulator)